MTYQELKELDRLDAIRMVLPPEFKIEDRHLYSFPWKSEVIVFGGNYWRSNESIAQFVEEFVNPQTEKDIKEFFEDIVYSIVSDPHLSNSELIKQVNVDYKLLYKQHYALYNNPDKVYDWAEAKGTFIWFDSILRNRREKQFVNIKKELDLHALEDISKQIKKVYKFSDAEITYLQYFCSQAKLDELDASLNTFLYMWSNEQYTGKTTVASYICSFLNGEKKRNAEPHTSKLKIEMQFDRFANPKATVSRCTLIDEGGFYDMSKVYDDFKQLITSNSCEIEYKYKVGNRTRRCFRNYIMTSNIDPIYFVQDEKERRILSIHFTQPEEMDFAEIEKMWHKFVLECNLTVLRLEDLYRNFIHPNSQVGELKNVMLELKDIFSKQRIDTCNPQTYFSVSNIMSFNEVTTQKKITRKIVKDVLVKLYGQPDKNQRFYKLNRVVQADDEIELPLPF